MSQGSRVRAPPLSQKSFRRGTLAGLAQVVFGQTEVFHLWTWSERPTFNREVRGSSPRVGTTKSFRRGNWV